MANEQNTQTASRSSDSVTIGCKLPSGIFLEHLTVQKDSWNPAPAGPRVKLNGANSVQQTRLVQVNPRVHEFGQTVVSREFWEKCVASGRYDQWIKNGQIFVVEPKGGAEATQKSFNAAAREKLPEKTGLEGLNPEGKDERLKKIRVPGQPETVVETDQEHLKRLRENLAA